MPGSLRAFSLTGLLLHPWAVERLPRGDVCRQEPQRLAHSEAFQLPGGHLVIDFGPRHAGHSDDVLNSEPLLGDGCRCRAFCHDLDHFSLHLLALPFHPQLVATVVLIDTPTATLRLVLWRDTIHSDATSARRSKTTFSIFHKMWPRRLFVEYPANSREIPPHPVESCGVPYKRSRWMFLGSSPY